MYNEYMIKNMPQCLKHTQIEMRCVSVNLVQLFWMNYNSVWVIKDY